MKIQITGASGFVGQNLKEFFLLKNIEIKDLSLRNSNWKNLIDGNVTALVHLAGKAHDTSNTLEDDAYFSINRDLTIELFTIFLKSNVRDFFYFSSVKAVADIVDGVLDENVVGNPQTPYGKSKLEAEEYLLKQILPNNKRLFIIRPCMIHGPGNKGNLNLLYKIVEKGIPWPLASFHNERSFLCIDNLSFLVDTIISNKFVTSGVYNFADDEVLSTNQLVILISKVLGKRAKLWNIPTSFIKLIVKLGDILPLPLNSERLKKLTESYIVSNTKIKMALGIEKLPFTVEEGLEKTIKSFKNRN
ncbi:MULTISPECIES: NAD-dependent epimerase/dehydratase family protein [unclassified Sphingobacterium]|uniref:NAD-dependent epimerase/dehydratase family protein n=1 Tax=unclassified Sphingobacterium TaxID=2609468 RepID=UPI001046E0BA|nr:MULTISPECIES: NAD-dependent epimerase/dehydratase family protein [unclassified Sphingobacterium]MCS3555849.1 nucleoside-diphosphate-sugar epimerase [Sphingobacterium sp. JUb21]TCR00698.1 nucleoside-diphosphate-sugar epimerase [Sphingobacterium sp. JUb20]